MPPGRDRRRPTVEAERDGGVERGERTPGSVEGRLAVDPAADSLRLVTERLTLLTVHAHPDDEASKGAPTVARYAHEGVHTVLVCCTGGEEGDLQNPTLREEGQPFHGLTPEQEKAAGGDMRADELAASAKIIGFDEVDMLGYRDSGMADTEAEQPSRLLPPGRHRRGHRPAGGDHPSHERPR